MRTRTAVLLTTAIIWAGLAGVVALISQPMVTPIPSTSPKVDPARLEAHVRKLSVDFYPRSSDQFEKLGAAANYIAGQFKAAGASVSIQEVTVQEATYQNIIARFGPHTGALMVIGAHYDSHGDAVSPRHVRGYSLETHTPGADDNASGVAGLLELARLLGRERQSRPIELVAYTTEEPPHFRSEHMGSVWHANALKAASREVRLMLSLEMIGYFSDEPGSQAFPILGMKQLYSDRGDFIALVGKLGSFAATRRTKALMSGATDLPVHSISAPRIIQGIDYSDHRSYWSAGYPALMVTDTAFLRNPNYHKAGDTYEKLDYGRAAKVVQGVYTVVRQF